MVQTMNKFDMRGKEALNRMEEIMNSTRLNEFLHRKEEEDKKKDEENENSGNTNKGEANKPPKKDETDDPVEEIPDEGDEEE